MTRPNRFLFDQAIVAFTQRRGRIIVEVGGIRNRKWRTTDGHSTLRWPADALVWSIDTDPATVRLTRELTADRQNVFCVLGDAIELLRFFPTRIDLLYLDGPHPDQEDGRRWHSVAYRVAPLQHRCVLLIDDTDSARKGKGEFVIPAAQEDGFQLIESDRQTLLVR